MKLINPKDKTKSVATVGGISIDLVVAPRADEKSSGLLPSIAYVFKSMFALLSGMKLTLSYFLRPSTIVTQQYPENRDTLKMFDRFRGQLKLTFDENDHMYCNGCNFCELACPNASIILKDRRNPVNNKLELDQYIWRLDSCTFCNACIQACPHDALEWSDDFEAAVYDRRLLVYTLNNYAGPPVTAFKCAEKKGDDIEALNATMNPRQIYEGKLPLCGESLPGVPALNIVINKQNASPSEPESAE